MTSNAETKKKIVVPPLSPAENPNSQLSFKHLGAWSRMIWMSLNKLDYIIGKKRQGKGVKWDQVQLSWLN